MGDAAAAGGSDGAGSAAASGMGIGVGAGLGFMIPGMIAQSAKAQGTAVQETIECAKCRAAVPAEAHFCPSCGTKVEGR
jgi:membrane protease subunit (stomatin/prohibitin family)